MHYILLRNDIFYKLDSECLRFRIALLDHRLMGDIFDSVIVGFSGRLGD